MTTDLRDGAILGAGLLCFVLMFCGQDWAGLGFLAAVIALNGKAVKP